MRIVGQWLRWDDGIVRPTIRVSARGAGERVYRQPLLIDSGADRTVLNDFLLRALGLPASDPPATDALAGVGGKSPFVVVTTALELLRDDGGSAIFRGEIAAFTDPATIDLSNLGRDVLDHFDVILSRRRDEVVLLAPPHQYQVSRAG